MRARSTCAGLSLLEVMFALAILAIVLSGVVVNMGALEGASARSDDDQLANDLLRSVMERVQEADYRELNTVGHWSEAEFLSTASPPGHFLMTTPPPAGGLTMQDLRDRGLLDWQLPFDDEAHYRGRFFIEYFQALEHDGVLGVMQAEYETDADYRARMGAQSLDGNMVLRLADRSAIAELGGAPFVVRLVLFAGHRRYEQMTAVRGEVF